MKPGSTVLLVIMLFLSGCARSPRVPNMPEPAPDESRSSAPPSTTPSAWTITPVTQQNDYRSIATTVTELVDSAKAAGDSITSTVDFGLSIIHGPEDLSYSATISELSFQGGSRTGTPSVGDQLPFSYTGRLHQGKLTISVDGTQPGNVITDCSNEAFSIAAAVQRAVLAVPSFLRKGMTWSDSTTAILCNGSILTTSITSRSFRVIGETGRGILIERQERTTSTGDGAQGQHRLRLQTSGKGNAQLIIDDQTGILLESTGVHTASVVVTTSGRNQQFTQTTRERIVIR